MKILYHHRIASKDGQYVHVEEIISSLRKFGHKVIVCEPKGLGSTTFGEGSRFVQVIRALLPGFAHELAEFLYSLPDYWKLGRLIEKHKPDMIYERYNLFFISGIWAAKRFKLPIALEVNSPLFQERSKNGGLSLKFLARWTEDYAWRNANFVLPVTGVLAKIVEARSVDKSRIHVIPNGINTEFTSELPDPADVDIEYALGGKLVLGFTGFVREWHRLDRVLNVIANNVDKNWHVLLVGEGPDRPRLESIAQDLGISDRLIITGIVDRKSIPGLVNRFDIALQPDVVPYASPLKMFEYMALQKPILAPDTENIREILRDRHNALLFSLSDASFEEKLKLLCEDSDLRLRLGFSARETIEREKLSWDSNALQIVSLFDRHNDILKTSIAK